MLLEIVVADAEAVHHTGAKILDEHVGPAHQLSQQVLALWSLEIEGDRLLAGILGEERHAHETPVQIRIGAKLTRQVAGAGHLHLDDFRAQMRQLVAAEGTREHVRQIEYAMAGKGTFHGCFLMFR